MEKLSVRDTAIKKILELSEKEVQTVIVFIFGMEASEPIPATKVS